jgi:hypothetical protein
VEEPGAESAGSQEGAAFYIGSGGPPIYLDAWTDVPRAGIRGDGGPVQISGRFDHSPVPGGNTAHIRRMTTGARAGVSPPPAEPAAPPRSGRRFGYSASEPGRRCNCGFAAYNWHRQCPKCGAALS